MEPMRRSGAVLALVFFLTTPLMQWRCVIACADEPSATVGFDCHQPSTVPNVQDLRDRDCDHPLSPAAMVTASRPLTNIGIGVATVSLPMAAQVLVASVAQADSRQPPGRPPTHTPPLRI